MANNLVRVNMQNKTILNKRLKLILNIQKLFKVSFWLNYLKIDDET